MNIFLGLEVDCQMIYLQKDSWPISLLKNFACTSDILSLAIVIIKQLPLPSKDQHPTYNIYISFF